MSLGEIRVQADGFLQVSDGFFHILFIKQNRSPLIELFLRFGRNVNTDNHRGAGRPLLRRFRSKLKLQIFAINGAKIDLPLNLHETGMPDDDPEEFRRESTESEFACAVRSDLIYDTAAESFQGNQYLLGRLAAVVRQSHLSSDLSADG